jgi:OmpA family/Glycine zipper
MIASLLPRAFMGGAAILVAGCATAPGQPGVGGALKDTFVSNDPCSNNARNIGVVGGALIGALLGNAVGGGKNESKIIGALVGGMAGGFIGADMDRRRCELSKVAQKYDLDMTFSNIESPSEAASANASGAPASGASSGASTSIGSTVSVREKAQEYFAAIAMQYAPDAMLAEETNSKRREEAKRQLSKRHILMLGHTDDTGATQVNASLSERRARAVAAFLKQKGVPEGNLFYQGAGETFPVADNRTDAGRAANRRVEIVEVADETSFKKYLDSRKPQYAFYRPLVEATKVTADKAVGSSMPSVAPKIAQSAPVAPVGRTAPATNAARQAAPAAPIINFGGAPYSLSAATIQTGSVVPAKGLNFISKAQADDSVVMTDCSYDRPRAAGTVKSLRDGSRYKTSEHLPQLYGKTWAGAVNGNLVVLNHLAVLRDGGAPANLPELKVYPDYKPGINVKAMVNEEPAVNSYLVDKGVLYRVFPSGDGGLKCMDLLFGTDGATTAKAGKLIYASGSDRYVADFKPQVQ